MRDEPSGVSFSHSKSTRFSVVAGDLDRDRPADRDIAGSRDRDHRGRRGQVLVRPARHVERDLHREQPFVADDLAGVGELLDRGGPVDAGGADDGPQLVDGIAALVRRGVGRGSR